MSDLKEKIVKLTEEITELKIENSEVKQHSLRMEKMNVDLINDKNTMRKQITELELDVAHQKYEHYTTCESEGLTWDGDIPEPPTEE